MLTHLRPSDDNVKDQLVSALTGDLPTSDLPRHLSEPSSAALELSEVLARVGRSQQYWPEITEAFNVVLEQASRETAYGARDFMGNVVGSTWWRLPGDYGLTGLTVSPWKVHFAAETVNQVLDLAGRLAPVLSERQMHSKFAGAPLLRSDNEQQNRKGAVVYLPRRETLADDLAAIASVTKGVRVDLPIPGDIELQPGMGIRSEWVLDLGCDLLPGYASVLYVPASFDPLDSHLQQLSRDWFALRRDNPELADPADIINAANDFGGGYSLDDTIHFVRTLAAHVAKTRSEALEFSGQEHVKEPASKPSRTVSRPPNQSDRGITHGR